MSDDVVRGLEMAIQYLEGAIRCRLVNDLNSGDINLVRAMSELDIVEMVLEHERIGQESAGSHSDS